MTFSISQDFLAEENRREAKALAEDYAALGRQLERRGLDIEKMTERAMAYAVAVPSWGVGTGGTRFARFPGPGEPRRTASGFTTLTRMPSGAPSSAMQRARCTSAAFAVQ